MKLLMRFIIWFGLGTVPTLLGQFTPPLQPDCAIPINMVTTGVTVSFDNRFKGCISWTMTYDSQGFSALSIAVQSAPDAGGTPGTWVTFAGTILAGVNPNTSTTQAATFFGTLAATDFQPWVRANLTSITGSGSVTGWLYGYRTGPKGGGGGGGGGPFSNVNLAQVNGHTTQEGGTNGSLAVGGQAAVGAAPLGNPDYTAGLDGLGNLIAPVYATSNAAISLTTSGLTTIVGLSGTRLIRIAHLSVAFASAVDFQLEYGTGGSCGTGTTALTGVYKGIGTIALDFQQAPLILPAGQALCVNLGTSVVGGGVITYARY